MTVIFKDNRPSQVTYYRCFEIIDLDYVRVDNKVKSVSNYSSKFDSF